MTSLATSPSFVENDDMLSVAWLRLGREGEATVWSVRVGNADFARSSAAGRNRAYGGSMLV